MVAMGAAGPMAFFISAAVAVLSQSAVAQFAPAAAPAAAPKPKRTAGVSKVHKKKIGMVVNTLKDILQSVVNEEKRESAIFGKYMTWCNSQNKAIATDLSETKSDLANAKVLAEEQVSSVDMLKLNIKKTGREMGQAKDAITQAVAIRKRGNQKYTEEMQLNTQSLGQIKKAIKHVRKVKKQGGFLQGGVMKKLTVNQPGESSYVLGVMRGLHNKLLKSRAILMRTEASNVKMHNSFLFTKGATLKSLVNTITEKRIAKSETSAQGSSQKRKVSKLKAEVARLTISASKTADSCRKTPADWTKRQDDRAKEKAAINEAVRYLTATALEQLSLFQDDEELFAPSFLQVRSASKASNNALDMAAMALPRESFADNQDKAAMALPRESMLQENEVSDHTRKKTLKGVQGVISRLISRHAATQKEERVKRAFCEKEIAAKDDDKSDTAIAFNAVKANIEKKNAESEMIADEMKKLRASMKSVNTNLAEAGTLRKQETKEFFVGYKDRSLAIRVLTQAKNVLLNFYSKGKFLQEGGAGAPAAAYKFRPAPAKPKWSSGTSKKVGGFGAVQMIQNIADSMSKENSDAGIAERQAAVAYEQLQQESAKALDLKQQAITEGAVNKAKLRIQINGLKETRTQKRDELDAINLALNALHRQCDELLKNFDKRKKSRAFEVNQLRDVKDIMAGASTASRTGFIQEKMQEHHAKSTLVVE